MTSFFNKKFNPLFRLFMILVNDVVLMNLTLYLSYYLRIEYFYPFNYIIEVFIFSTFIYLIIFFYFKINKQYFRYFNSNAYRLYFRAFIFFSFLFGCYVFFQSNNYIPRSLVFIFPVFFFSLLVISRILVTKFFIFQNVNLKKKVVIFGFNPSTFGILSNNYKVLCFIDDKKYNYKRIINDVKIISSNKFIKSYSSYKFDLILIESEKIFNKSKYQIRKHIINKKILVQKISMKNNEIITSSYLDFNYFFNRKNKISPLGTIYDQKVILITGAGGSIGSNIVFQVMNCNYKKLILLDCSEFNLYELANSIPNNDRTIFLLNNFNDMNEMQKIFDQNDIDIVFHAAAYKHVPLIEVNPFSAIKNNFLDTFNFMKLSIKNNLSFFCLISSDKAVRPTNIMGSSKRLSELALQYFSKIHNHKTTFCAVRFGNVINSSGSVMPLFKKQIDNNLPLTLTHKNIIRYFMTIEEAANLVLNTNKISKGGEIFLLDMGEPIKLFDLAKFMIQFSGKKIKSKKDSKGDIEIKIIGLRKGEKLYEELLVDKESVQTEIKSIYQSIENKISILEFKKLHNKLIECYKLNDLQKLLSTLNNNFIKYDIRNSK